MQNGLFQVLSFQIRFAQKWGFAQVSKLRVFAIFQNYVTFVKNEL